MIHVCFSLYDLLGTYSKYEAVAICSLLETTKENVTVYILHDETLSKTNKNKFIRLVESYKQRLVFLPIQQCILNDYKHQAKQFTIGTLFRFFIPELLPSEICRVIYLDADVIVNLDIVNLWKVDLGNNIGAAVPDCRVIKREAHPKPCEEGIVPYDTYFNAGVLLLDIEKIRKEYDIKKDGLAILKKNPEWNMLDQDVLNVMFYGKIKMLPPVYNVFTRVMREKKSREYKCIIHVAADYINPENPMWFDKKFFKYWLKTPWNIGTDIMGYARHFFELKYLQIIAMQAVIKKVTMPKYKIIIWGVNGRLSRKISRMVNLRKDKDYYVDKNPALHRNKVNECQVFSPEKLLKEPCEETIVIVASLRFYNDIKEELERYGFRENYNFVDGRLMISQDDGGYVGYY